MVNFDKNVKYSVEVLVWKPDRSKGGLEAYCTRNSSSLSMYVIHKLQKLVPLNGKLKVSGQS